MLEKTAPATLYDRDFSLWVAAQVEALRAARFADLDLPNVIEELDGLAKRDRSAMQSQLRRLFLHMLKLRYQPEKRSHAWEDSIGQAMQKVFDILDASPSLRREVLTYAIKAYAGARTGAARETRLPLATFPGSIPNDFQSVALALADVTTDDALDALIRRITDV
jgi:hypothetical protein